MEVDKIIRDGRVAVIISPGYGGGWSTWADHEIREQLLFDPDVVNWILDGKAGPMPDIQHKYGDYYIFEKDGDDLVVAWVSEGTKFRISEYDGFESIITEEEHVWFVA